ncbi:MAG: hypothetical protein AAGU39_07605 [Sedimentibacter saalensis]|uniref:hypothetical protein n=1 Tax=Sedimentibacter saalensis TaxID=130788 RepID=UPI00315912CF
MKNINNKKTHVDLRPNKYAWITTHYYLIAIFISFTYLFSDSIRVGVINATIMMFIVIDYLFKKFIGRNILINKTTLLIIMYLIYNLFSIFIGVINGYSISIGISEFSNGLLPIIFYFVGIEMDNYETSVFVKSFINSILFLVCVGVFMYFFQPSIYFSYMQRTIVNYYLGSYMAAPRMHSFTGSVVLGSLTCMALAFELSFLVYSKKLHRHIFLSTILLGSIILTMQRSAMVFGIANIILICIHTLKSKYISFKRIAMYSVIILVFIVIIFYLFPNLLEQLILRVSSMSNAINERNSNWNLVWKQGIETIGGSGLGTRGHRGMYISEITILDGNYFKMIYEIGLIGSILFINIILSVVTKGIKVYHSCVPYFSIVLGVLFQAIGSNTLGFQLVMPMFWFAIGRINFIYNSVKSTKHREEKNNEDFSNLFTTIPQG